MRITMTQAEVTEVLRKHFASTGIKSDLFDIKYTAGRKGNGLTVEIDIAIAAEEPMDLPSFPKDPPVLTSVPKTEPIIPIEEAEEEVIEPVAETKPVEDPAQEPEEEGCPIAVEPPVEEAPKKTVSLFSRPAN